jgi:hypothetical protein
MIYKPPQQNQSYNNKNENKIELNQSTFMKLVKIYSSKN